MNQTNQPWRPPQQQQQWQPQQQQWQPQQQQQQPQQWQPQQQRPMGPPQGPPSGPPGAPPGALPKSKQGKLPSAKKKRLLRILLGLLIVTAICTIIAAGYFYINYV